MKDLLKTRLIAIAISCLIVGAIVAMRRDIANQGRQAPEVEISDAAEFEDLQTGVWPMHKMSMRSELDGSKEMVWTYTNGNVLRIFWDGSGWPNTKLILK